MTSHSLTRSNAYGEISWHEIDWRQAHQNVRRLQMRIVKAVKDRKWHIVRALQRLLTRSLSAAVMAVKRVTESHGKKTAGVDNVLWSTPRNKSLAIQEVRQKKIRKVPLKRIYISKANNRGKRPLSIPAMSVRAQQALYLLALDPISETLADPNSYGFRPERSTADAIKQCFIVLSRKASAEYILEGDIKSCFDNISFEWIEKNIPIEKKVLKQWLKAGYIENKVLYNTESGVPQGGLCKALHKPPYAKKVIMYRNH